MRQLASWVGLFGLLTIGLMLIGWQTIGQLFALLQLGGFVGAPLALLLQPQLRSRAAVFVFAPVLSIAVSALAAQSLVWFELAGPETVVLAATGYGAVLAWLLASESEGESVAEELLEHASS